MVRPGPFAVHEFAKTIPMLSLDQKWRVFVAPLCWSQVISCNFHLWLKSSIWKNAPFFNWFSAWTLHQGLGRSLRLFLPRPLSLGLVQSNHLARYTRYIECTRLCSTQQLGAVAGEFLRTARTCQWQSEWSCTLAVVSFVESDEGWDIVLLWSARQWKKEGGLASCCYHLWPWSVKVVCWWTVYFWWGWCPVLESEFDFPLAGSFLLRKTKWKEDKGRSSRCYSDVTWNCCTFHSTPLCWLQAHPRHDFTSHYILRACHICIWFEYIMECIMHLQNSSHSCLIFK